MNVNQKQINIKNRRVLIRVDFNVPIKNKKIQSDFRIKAVKETIEHCIKNNVSIVLMSHLGRPEKVNLKYSLKVVFEYLKTFFGNKIYFSSDCVSEEAIALSQKIKLGEIHLLENLRFHSEELTCDRNFSKKLSEH